MPFVTLVQLLPIYQIDVDAMNCMVTMGVSEQMVKPATVTVT
jgi:hypothetical protein